MNVLFLAHCVPYPPDKGEKIRAFEEIKALARRHRVHLACFARDAGDADGAAKLREYCASVHVEVLPFRGSLARAAVRFACGGCLNEAFFESRTMREYVGTLSIDVAVIYTLPMCQYVPAGVPELFDMVDADSEKWAEYAGMRRCGFLYRMESRRLRERELFYGNRAHAVYLTTLHETRSFEGAIAAEKLNFMENGVDFAFFDPQREYAHPSGLEGPYVVFVGTMDYFPNVDAACWFAHEVFPILRALRKDLKFAIVGNRPAQAVQELARIEGVVVTRGVPDVRPYLAHAAAVVTPLRLARGIQNKVLEALSMGRRVLASSEVCRTFGGALPDGVTPCGTAEEFVAGVSRELDPEHSASIRDNARARFSWDVNVEAFVEEVGAMARVAVSQ